MKSIELLELRFYNIQSYGNNLNTFVFKNGITWISGPNGVGKSTIIEALTYVLFGEPYKSDVNLDKLINTSNKKGLLVELDFIIHSSNASIKYTVKRGMKPKTFSLEENGIITPRIAGMNQKSFEEDVLGFDKRLFVNAISLNTLETKPFIDMKTDDKRKFLESATSFDATKMKKKISSELSQANVKMTTSINDMKNYSNKISDLQAILAQLEKEKEVDLSEFQNQIDEKKLSIKTLQEKSLVLTEELNRLLTIGKEVTKKLEGYRDIDSKIKNLEQVLNLMEDVLSLKENFATKTSQLMEEEKTLKTFKKNFDSLNKEFLDKQEKLKKFDGLDQKLMEQNTINYRAKSEMDRIFKEQGDIKVGVPCPYCKKPSTEEDKEHLLIGYREDYQKHNKTFKESKKVLETLNKEKEEYSSIKTEYDSLKTEVAKNEQNLISQEKVIKTLTNDLTQISLQIDSKKNKADQLVPDFNIEKEPKEPLLKKIESLKKDKEVSDEITKEFNALKDNGLKHRYEISGIENTIKTINTEITQIEEKIEKKKSSDSKDVATVTKKAIETTSRDLAELQESIKKVSDDIEILTYMSEMFGDDGIKKTIIGTFVPVLNKAIEKNLKIFNLPFSIEFNDSLDYVFTAGYGSAPDYPSLSQGQKRKLHFSISMAFRDFVTMIGDFRINIIFLDEVLDISVDNDGLGSMFDVLKTKNKEIPGIYLMTHRGENFSEYFDNILEVKHDGRFSEIVEVR